MRFVSIILLPLLLVVSSTTSAQEPASNGPSARGTASDPFSRVRIGQRIRWTQQDSGSIEGTYRGRTDGTILVQLRDGPRSVPQATMDSLWSRGHSARPGALVGALVGGILIGLMGKELDNNYGEGGFGSGFALGLAVGGGGGLLLGAAIGSAFPRWQRRFP